MNYLNNHKHKFVKKDADKEFPVMQCEECEFELDVEYYEGYVLPLEVELKEWQVKCAFLEEQLSEAREEITRLGSLRAMREVMEESNQFKLAYESEKEFCMKVIEERDELKSQSAINDSRLHHQDRILQTLLRKNEELKIELKEEEELAKHLKNEIEILRKPLEKIVNSKYAKDVAMNCLLDKITALQQSNEILQKQTRQRND